MGNHWGLPSYFRHNKQHLLWELKQIKKLGFDGATIVDPDKFTLKLTEIKKAFKDSQLSLLQICCDYCNIAHPDPEKCQGNILCNTAKIGVRKARSKYIIGGKCIWKK